MSKRPRKTATTYGQGTISVESDEERLRLLAAMIDGATLAMQTADGSWLDFVVTTEDAPGTFSILGVFR